MNLCLLASVLGVHGLQGWLKVVVHSDVENRLSFQESVLVGSNERRTKSFKIESSRDGHGRTLVKLESIDDRTAAESLVGSNFYIPDDEMLPPPDGRYFVHDLIGCEIFDAETGARRGVIRDVMLLPANDVYVVDADGEEVLVPAIPTVVVEVDIAAKRITITPIPGLFEDDEDEN